MSPSSRSRCVTARMCVGLQAGTAHPASRAGQHVRRAARASTCRSGRSSSRAVELHRHPGSVQLAEPTRALVDREQLDVVIERVTPQRRRFRLPHSTAEQELLPPRDRHQVGRPGEDAPRAAEAFEGERDRVDARPDLGRRPPKHSGIHHPRPSMWVDAASRVATTASSQRVATPPARRCACSRRRARRGADRRHPRPSSMPRACAVSRPMPGRPTVSSPRGQQHRQLVDEHVRVLLRDEHTPDGCAA
jgi:hypothetical protein